jgi:hypothetical protein
LQDDLDIQEELDINGNRTGKWSFLNQNNNDMSDEDISDRFNNNINLTTTTISDHIQQNNHSGDNLPVFAHVYEPNQGTREVLLVAIKHVPEALSQIKQIKIKLSRVMSKLSIQLALADVEDIIELAATTPPWQPFDIQTAISATTTTTTYNETNHHPRTKRSRATQHFRT